MNFKILVADDEYYARKALVMMLEKSGLPISVNGDFEDGEEVIEYLQENEADIIITDIRMPNVDGLELAKYVQEHVPKFSVRKKCAALSGKGLSDKTNQRIRIA